MTAEYFSPGISFPVVCRSKKTMPFLVDGGVAIQAKEEPVVRWSARLRRSK
jgi:hypothetical protein